MKIFNTKEEYVSLGQEHVKQALGLWSHLVSFGITIATGAVLVDF